MKTPVQLAQMTYDQYNRYLKRQRFTGLAAARMDMKRRQGLKHLDSIPAINTSADNLAYMSGLKVGEQVIECGECCMKGCRGTVYQSTTGGGLCVKWILPAKRNGGKVGWMGTSVTWGTRRLTDAPAPIAR